MSAPGIRLSIDRLVLDGIAHGDAAAVQRAIALQLDAMLGGADPARFAELSREQLQLDIAPAGDPAALGRSAGQALGRALGLGGQG